MSEVPPRKRGRPRDASADSAILDTTIELLRERGYRDFNVDVVSDRTGIAKSTIYRRWPSKGALVAAAIAPLPSGLDAEAIVADTERVLALLRDPDGEAIDVIRATIVPRHAALAALLGEHEADARIGALLVRLLVR
jgi:AcrR family transcriptional regulator